jgi:carbohydrate-selective porin OprB
LRTNEAIFQSYYQAFIRPGVFFQPVVTYVPNPGERPGIRDAWALTFQVTILY